MSGPGSLEDSRSLNTTETRDKCWLLEPLGMYIGSELETYISAYLDVTSQFFFYLQSIEILRCALWEKQKLFWSISFCLLNGYWSRKLSSQNWFSTSLCPVGYCCIGFRLNTEWAMIVYLTTPCELIKGSQTFFE